MSRGASGSVTWREERYNPQTAHWEFKPMVAYAERLGAASNWG